ncbi:Lrp/AsnC ligand binding domain-containing protein [Haloarculaceae archaeon H-GB2-1]|nr:Lrp/AsnC ligand binding domain-containing protein [Haloarculaceae archaeon H-GB1-1]MEA5388984.1 Lrp/AsnC ligand binding domain-containing protein [Haloarculaceae archaeon H-GB11]MEA5407042.1 Lrp/AsnC ligand binding domain-containing protein [Haloarculaceae archaeon H-GB2-1]
MPKAYIVVLTATGTTPSVVEAIRALDGVTEAHVVAGEFDVMVEAEADELVDLKSLLTDGIHHIDGVGHTRTHVVLDE